MLEQINKAIWTGASIMIGSAICVCAAIGLTAVVTEGKEELNKIKKENDGHII